MAKSIARIGQSPSLLAATMLAGMCSTANAQSGTGDPAANWQAIAICAQQPSERARHECVDNVLRATGLLDQPQEVAQQRETFGEPERRQVPGAPPPPPELPPEFTSAPPPPPEIDRLLTTIEQAMLGSDRKLIFRTAEGAVWKQLDGPRIRKAPDAGTPLSIEEAALSSYRCRFGSIIFRCERLD